MASGEARARPATCSSRWRGPQTRSSTPPPVPRRRSPFALGSAGCEVVVSVRDRRHTGPAVAQTDRGPACGDAHAHGQGRHRDQRAGERECSCAWRSPHTGPSERGRRREPAPSSLQADVRARPRPRPRLRLAGEIDLARVDEAAVRRLSRSSKRPTRTWSYDLSGVGVPRQRRGCTSDELCADARRAGQKLRISAAPGAAVLRGASSSTWRVPSRSTARSPRR